MAFLTTKNIVISDTSDPEDDTARLDSFNSGVSIMSVSIKANATNAGTVYIRRYNSGGDWMPLAAGDACVLDVSNLNLLEAYSTNGNEAINIIIHV